MTILSFENMKIYFGLIFHQRKGILTENKEEVVDAPLAPGGLYAPTFLGVGDAAAIAVAGGGESVFRSGHKSAFCGRHATYQNTIANN